MTARTALRWLAIVSIAGTGASAMAQPMPAPPPLSLTDKGTHFDHADHARRLPLEPCAQCHAMADNGLPMAPAAIGHSPCLSSNCHANFFLAGQSKDANLVLRATAFCQGCHDTPDGKMPLPSTKPTWNTALRSFEAERDWHVEMPHFDHVRKDRERTDCRSCHVTGDASTDVPWALVAGTPGHAQCRVCHNSTDPVLHMDQCEHCHKVGSRAAYLGKSRDAIDVRACDSEGYVKYLALFKAKGSTKPVPCFKHEREEHRVAYAAGKPATDTSGKPVEVECASCHYTVNDAARWGAHKYETLADLHKNPIIDNRGNEEHKSCSTNGGCHTSDMAANRCELCHAGRNAF